MDYDTHGIDGAKTDAKSTTDNMITKDSDNTKKMSGNNLENHDVGPTMISNDCADYVVVECNLCGAHKTITNLRAHTKSAHKLTITEYKKQFGQLAPVQVVMHKCGICSELVLLDSDQISEKYEILSARNPCVALSRPAPHFQDEIVSLKKRPFLAGF